MKPSTRQRFVALHFDYPIPSIEQEILIGETERRLLIYAAILIKHGFDPVDACRAALVEQVVLATFGKTT